MAKSRQSQSDGSSTPVIEGRKWQTRRAAEDEKTKQILNALTGVGVAIVVVFVVGLAYTFLVRPNRAVATVNGQDITLSDYQKRVYYERYLIDEQLVFIQQQTNQILDQFADQPELQQQLTQQGQQQLQQLSFQRQTADRNALDDLIEEQLVMDEAAKRGIMVTEDEVSEQYNRIVASRAGGYTEAEVQETVVARQDATAAALLFTPTPKVAGAEPASEGEPTATPPPAPTPTINAITGQAFTDAQVKWEETMSKNTGMTGQDLREVVRRNLLRQKLVEQIGETANTTAMQTNARHILVDTQEEAAVIKARIESGEDFATIAAEVSQDQVNGGELGWFAEEEMVAPFSEAAFALEVGAISDPVQTDFGWHIIEVLGREERELEGNALDRARQRAYADWLQVAKSENVIDNFDIDYAPRERDWS